MIICFLAESATWPVYLFLVCQSISFFILLFFNKRFSRFSLELYQSKSKNFRWWCWQVVEWFKSSQFTFGKQSIFITRQHGFYPNKPDVDYVILALSRTCFCMYFIVLPIHFQCCFIFSFFTFCFWRFPHSALRVWKYYPQLCTTSYIKTERFSFLWQNNCASRSSSKNR